MGTNQTSLLFVEEIYIKIRGPLVVKIIKWLIGG